MNGGSLKINQSAAQLAAGPRLDQEPLSFAPQISAEVWASSHEAVNRLLTLGSQVILGKDFQLRLCLACLLAEGHLLIEDVPGVGKTTLVKFLARVLGLKAKRIQMTNDLLPGDILGTTIFDRVAGEFRFQEGPIFSQMLILDELNRATPKTQSATLQAMEEREVSMDGVNHILPFPFLVVATQNPHEQSGTYSLPESQLDRFLMRVELGFPDRHSERALLTGQSRASLIETIKPVIDISDLRVLMNCVQSIHVSPPILDYVQNILAASRTIAHEGSGGREDHWGLSPRAGMALLKAARSWAFLQNRTMVLPEDVQAVTPPVIAHRLVRAFEASFKRGVLLAEEILLRVGVD